MAALRVHICPQLPTSLVPWLQLSLTSPLYKPLTPADGHELPAAANNNRHMMTINTRPDGQTAEVRLVPEGLITKDELARRLRKSIRTIETWQRRRLIPFIKVANSVLFDWDKVQQHLSERFSVVETNPDARR